MARGDHVDSRKDPVEDIAERAGRVAAQRVAKIHRRRLVFWSFVAALAASAAINIPIVLHVSAANRETARNNSAYNCDLLKQIAGLSALKADYFEAFLKSDAHLRFRQQHFRERQRLLTAFSAIIEPGLLQRLQARSDRVDYHARRFWKMRLAPAMHAVATKTRALANVNCRAALNGKTTRASPPGHK